MKYSLLVVALLLLTCTLFAQDSDYVKTMNKYIENYVAKHEVVTGKDKDFMKFYPVNEKYRVKAKFEKTENSPWFRMESSGSIKQLYRIYGTAIFTINDTISKLNIYQSQNLMGTEKYRDHLFLPFLDLTSGIESYETGRYFDLSITDIKEGMIELDFNKVYNPYCAYVSDRYSCPIPPKENHLTIAIPAGEKKYAKTH